MFTRLPAARLDFSGGAKISLDYIEAIKMRGVNLNDYIGYENQAKALMKR
jgi:hypothetical protein